MWLVVDLGMVILIVGGLTKESINEVITVASKVFVAVSSVIIIISSQVEN